MLAHMHMMATYMSHAPCRGVHAYCPRCCMVQQTLKYGLAPASFHLHVDDVHVPSWHTRWPHEPCRAVCVVPALLVLHTSTVWHQHHSISMTVDDVDAVHTT
jgi:hypothetical protein